MNVNYIASSFLQAIYQKVQIQLFLFLSQTNSFGIVQTQYSLPINIDANVQLMTNQQLEHVDGYNQTKIYKNFWINNDQLKGLDRNINTGGDYLTQNNLVYKIIGVQNNYSTNWVLVNTIESDEI